jgi:hypothetical protein
MTFTTEFATDHCPGYYPYPGSDGCRFCGGGDTDHQEEDMATSPARSELTHAIYDARFRRFYLGSGNYGHALDAFRMTHQGAHDLRDLLAQTDNNDRELRVVPMLEVV